MARSVWKGPFVDGYLLNKADASRASGRNEIIRIWSRRSTAVASLICPMARSKFPFFAHATAFTSSSLILVTLAS